MSNQTLNPVVRRRTTSLVPTPGVYGRGPKRSRIVDWLVHHLLRRGYLIQHYEESAKVTEVPITDRKFLDAVHTMIHEARGYGAQPTHVVVGADAQRELLSITEPFGCVFNPDPQMPSLMGLTVIFAPWVDGFCVLPDISR